MDVVVRRDGVAVAADLRYQTAQRLLAAGHLVHGEVRRIRPVVPVLDPADEAEPRLVDAARMDFVHDLLGLREGRRGEVWRRTVGDERLLEAHEYVDADRRQDVAETRIALLAHLERKNAALAAQILAERERKPAPAARVRQPSVQNLLALEELHVGGVFADLQHGGLARAAARGGDARVDPRVVVTDVHDAQDAALALPARAEGVYHPHLLPLVLLHVDPVAGAARRIRRERRDGAAEDRQQISPGLLRPRVEQTGQHRQLHHAVRAAKRLDDVS